MSSVEYSCKLSKPIFAYRQTVWTLIRLLLEEQSDLGPCCLQKWLLKSQADDKADDNCCWTVLYLKPVFIIYFNKRFQCSYFHLLTLSSLYFYSGFFHLWIWSEPLSQIGISVKNKNRMANCVDPDEMVHYEQSHHDLHCLQKKTKKKQVLVCRA